MRQRWYMLLMLFLLMILLVVQPGVAGNGKISGSIKTASGDPAVGANITLEGTGLGASADVTGRYFVLNVPPGTYRVTMWHEGFRARGVDREGRPAYPEPRTVTKDVTIGPKAVASVDFELR